MEIELKINLQGISFDDDSDEDADWKRKDLNEVEVSFAKAFRFLALNRCSTIFHLFHPFCDVNVISVNICRWVARCCPTDQQGSSLISSPVNRAVTMIKYRIALIVDFQADSLILGM